MAVLNVAPFMRESKISNGALRVMIAEQGDWLNTFEFSNGVITPGVEPSEERLEALWLPERLEGLSVIEVGAQDGFFAFQSEARGASRVVAVDTDPARPQSSAVSNFHLVRRLLQSHVEEAPADLDAMRALGTFDICLFIGALHKSPNMLSSLHQVRAVTKSIAIIETVVDLLNVEQPSAAFYALNPPDGDRSAWWGPNLSCVEEMLGRAGFARTVFKGMWEVNKKRISASPAGRPSVAGRAVFHAFV